MRSVSGGAHSDRRNGSENCHAARPRFVAWEIAGFTPSTLAIACSSIVLRVWRPRNLRLRLAIDVASLAFARSSTSVRLLDFHARCNFVFLVRVTSFCYQNCNTRTSDFSALRSAPTYPSMCHVPSAHGKINGTRMVG